MSDIINNLADYVRAVIDQKRLNYREVAARSNNLITHSTVYDIINGRSKNPTRQTLQGLAKGLGVTEEELFAVSRGKKPNEKNVADEKFENLSLKFSGLSPSKREKAEALLDLIDREIDRLANEK